MLNYTYFNSKKFPCRAAVITDPDGNKLGIHRRKR